MKEHLKYIIITPTFNRWHLLKRNIKSVQSQNYNNIIHIIIDDSTNSNTFNKIQPLLKNNKSILYIRNNKNLWVNYSRNQWLIKAPKETNYIIFLDDDDYLNEHAIIDINNTIYKTTYNWYISNKKNITQVWEYNKFYDYIFDYFSWNRISWDATHIIKASIAKSYNFSKIIKQWQEWLYWWEIWNYHKFYTLNLDTTVSEYQDNGLSKNNQVKIYLNYVIWIIEFVIYRTVKWKYQKHIILQSINFLFKKWKK